MVVGIEEDTCWDECCMEVMNHGNLPPKPRAHCIHCMLANLTINYIKKIFRSIKMQRKHLLGIKFNLPNHSK